jgi:PEP-CTERM motif
MFTSRKLLSAVAGLSMLAASAASSAAVLSFGDANYLGLVNDGIPSSLTAEVSYINALNDLAAGASAVPCPSVSSEECDRIGSTLAGPFANALLADAVKFDTTSASDTYSTTETFHYVLGKYDAGQAGSMVWYFAGGITGLIDLQDTLNGKGLSHISLFNPDGGGGGGGSTPEPATLALVGLGLLGTAAARRRLQRR